MHYDRITMSNTVIHAMNLEARINLVSYPIGFVSIAPSP